MRAKRGSLVSVWFVLVSTGSSRKRRWVLLVNCSEEGKKPNSSDCMMQQNVPQFSMQQYLEVPTVFRIQHLVEQQVLEHEAAREMPDAHYCWGAWSCIKN